MITINICIETDFTPKVYDGVKRTRPSINIALSREVANSFMGELCFETNHPHFKYVVFFIILHCSVVPVTSKDFRKEKKDPY